MHAHGSMRQFIPYHKPENRNFQDLLNLRASHTAHRPVAVRGNVPGLGVAIGTGGGGIVEGGFPPPLPAGGKNPVTDGDTSGMLMVGCSMFPVTSGVFRVVGVGSPSGAVGARDTLDIWSPQRVREECMPWAINVSTTDKFHRRHPR